MRSKSSPMSVTALQSLCFTRERGISPNHSRPRASTLGTSLPLAPSDQLRIETISFSPRYSDWSWARRICQWSLMKLGTHRWCLGLPSSRAHVRGLALCLLHSEAPTLGLLHVLLPLTPWTRTIHSDYVTLLCTAQIPAGTVVACSTGFHQTSSINTVRLVISWTHYVTQLRQVLQCGHFSRCARCSSRNTLFSCLQIGSFALRQERVLGPSDVSLSSNNKTSSPRPQSWNCPCPSFVSVLSQAKSVASSCWASLKLGLNCLGGRYLASQYRWHIGSWDDLDHFYHNVSQSAPGSDGLGCTQFVQQCAIKRALVIDPTISPISSMTWGTFFVDILYIHAGTSTTASAINCGFSTNSALPRPVHVAEVVSEALVSELSTPASHRLDAATEDHHSCVDVRNQWNLFQTCWHRVSSETHEYLTLGYHQCQRQIIIADVGSTLNIGTLLVDGQHFTIYSPMFATASSFAFLVSHSLWPWLENAVSRSVLMNFSSIVSFFCVSLCPWCMLLRLATSHPSQLARDIVNLLFLLNTHFHVLHFHVLRTVCWCSRARLLWTLSCKTTSWALFSRTLYQLNSRQIAHHTFYQARQCSFIVGSPQDSLEPQLCFIAECCFSVCGFLSSCNGTLWWFTTMRGVNSARVPDSSFGEVPVVNCLGVVHIGEKRVRCICLQPLRELLWHLHTTT